MINHYSPEKDHAAQIRSFYELLQSHPEYKAGPEVVKLVLIGGCRNDADAKRVDGLRALAKDLGVNVSLFPILYLVLHI